MISVIQVFTCLRQSAHKNSASILHVRSINATHVNHVGPLSATSVNLASLSAVEWNSATARVKFALMHFASSATRMVPISVIRA